MVPPASHKLTGVRGTQVPTRPLAPSPTGLSPSAGGLSSPFGSALLVSLVGPTTPPVPKNRRFGLFPPRSPLLRESRLISSRPATEMFQFAGCPSLDYTFTQRCLVITPGGLPHSDTQGSSLVCSSPCTFRRSPRPSSAFSAWASSSYSLSLVSLCTRSYFTHLNAYEDRSSFTQTSTSRLCYSLLVCFFLPSAKLK